MNVCMHVFTDVYVLVYKWVTEKAKAIEIIEQLESYNPTDAPCLSDLTKGSWELVFSNTNLFRSSPFFMAARAVCKVG